MGVRIISEGGHFAPAVSTFKGPLGIWRGTPGGRRQDRRSSVPRLTVSFDGTTGKEGLPAALPANEAWLDPTILLQPAETQFSMSALYTGAGTCKVYGSMLPVEYAYRVAGDEGASLVSVAASQWVTITTLNPNVPANLFGTDNIMFTLYRFEFLLATQPGTVVLTAM